MGAMKDFDRRIRQGGDDAIAAVSEYVKELEGEVACARACAEMMLQGTGQKLGEEWARRVMDEQHSPRWIPVEERLPEEGEPVLVAIRFRHWTDEMPTLIVSSWYEHEDFCGDENDIPYQGVTHWMPLPEPPEVK